MQTSNVLSFNNCKVIVVQALSWNKKAHLGYIKYAILTKTYNCAHTADLSRLTVSEESVGW